MYIRGGGDFMTFGERLKYFRVKSKISQQDLSDLLNITPQTISKCENDLSKSTK